MSAEDILAIRALADRYSDAANRLDPVGMAGVYAEDAELVAFNNSYKGRATIQKIFEGTCEMMAFINQACSGAVIEVDGDTATSRWTITEFTKRHDFDTLEMFLGTYEDELVRRKGEWLYSRRTLTRRARVRHNVEITIGSPA